MKHTPGPWTVHREDTIDRGISWGVKAPVPHHWAIPPLNIPEADARLIAAAPDLLEALDRVLNYWEPECQAEDCNKGWHVDQFHAWQVAKAAVAKAHGGQP